MHSTNHRKNGRCHYYENWDKKNNGRPTSGVSRIFFFDLYRLVTFWGIELVANEVKMSNKFVAARRQYFLRGQFPPRPFPATRLDRMNHKD